MEYGLSSACLQIYTTAHTRVPHTTPYALYKTSTNTPAVYKTSSNTPETRTNVYEKGVCTSFEAKTPDELVNYVCFQDFNVVNVIQIRKTSPVRLSKGKMY